MAVRRFVLAAAVACFALAVPGGADPPDAAGWWWKAQATPLVVVPTPPTVPAGGLYVAGDPTGPFGVSAVRLFVPVDAVVGQMVLKVASAQGTVAVRACVTSVAWAPEQGGQLAGAPAYDCSASAPGLLDAATNAVAFEVSPLVRDGFLNVVVVPQDGAVFQASFQPPGPDTVTVTTASSSGFDDSGEAASEDFSYLEGPAFTDVPSSSFDPGVPLLTDPALPSVTPPTTAAAPRAQTAPRRIVPLPKNISEDGGIDRDSLWASFVFTGLLGLFLLLLQQPGRVPRALVGSAGGDGASVVPTRGVGRFRRPRTGPAPRL